MEITKDNYLDIKYDENKSALEIGNKTSKNVSKENRFITGLLSGTAILVMINILLVYKFFEILCTL